MYTLSFFNRKVDERLSVLHISVFPLFQTSAKITTIQILDQVLATRSSGECTSNAPQKGNYWHCTLNQILH